MRGARAADSGARLGSPGMPGPGALGAGASPGSGKASRAGAPGILCWENGPREALGLPALAWEGPCPGPGTPEPPPPRRARSSAAVFTSTETFPDLSAAATLQPTAGSPPLPPAPPRPAPGMLMRPPLAIGLGTPFFWGRGHADEGRRAGHRLAVAAAEPRGRWLEKAAGGASSSAVLGHSRNQSERFEASLGGAS